MGKVAEMIDSGFEFAYDLATSRSIPHYIGEKITDATLKLLREIPEEDHDQATA